MQNTSWEELTVQFLSYRSGDARNVRRLFENLHFILKKFCYFKGRSTDVEDLAQQILLKIHLSRDDFDENKKFKTWFFAIAQNAIIDNWRMDKKKKYSFVDESVIDEEVVEESLVLKGVDDKDELNFILKDLNPVEGTLLKLYYIEEFTAKEISQMLNLNENSIKVKLHRLIKKMRNIHERN